MTNGPIEFLSDVELHETPETEYGGRDGLIQTGPGVGDLVAADGMPIRHEVSASESLGVMSRRARVPNEVTVATEGRDNALPVQDPVTGRVLADSETGSDVSGKWGNEHGLDPR